MTLLLGGRLGRLPRYGLCASIPCSVSLAETPTKTRWTVDFVGYSPWFSRTSPRSPPLDRRGVRDAVLGALILRDFVPQKLSKRLATRQANQHD